MRGFIARLQHVHATGDGLGFATIDRAAGTPIGSSSYFAADAAHRHLEIGGTWVTPSRQRTPVNTEVKLLMLRHAFEVLGCRRPRMAAGAGKAAGVPGAVTAYRLFGTTP
jgi:RimJ/RimL family protein N-acetyltransferase